MNISCKQIGITIAVALHLFWLNLDWFQKVSIGILKDWFSLVTVFWSIT